MYLPLWIIIPPWKRFKKTGLSFPWTTLTYRKKREITTPSTKSGSILPQGQTNNQGLNPFSVNSFHWLVVWWCLGGRRPQGCHGYWMHLTAVLGSTSFPGTSLMLIYCYNEFLLEIIWSHIKTFHLWKSINAFSWPVYLFWSSNLIVRRNWMLVTTGAYVIKTKSRKNNMLHWLHNCMTIMKMCQSHLQNKM